MIYFQIINKLQSKTIYIMKQTFLGGIIIATIAITGYFVYPIVEKKLKDPEIVTEENADNSMGNVDDSGSLDETLGEILPGRWEGINDVGTGWPVYFQFSLNGHVTMFEHDENKKWIQIQDYNLVKGRIETDKEDIDDILEWDQVLAYELYNSENDLESYSCMTLYPEGAQVGAVSPFNMILCLNDLNHMKITMLKHTFILEKVE